MQKHHGDIDHYLYFLRCSHLGTLPHIKSALSGEFLHYPRKVPETHSIVRFPQYLTNFQVQSITFHYRFKNGAYVMKNTAVQFTIDFVCYRALLKANFEVTDIGGVCIQGTFLE